MTLEHAQQVLARVSYYGMRLRLERPDAALSAFPAEDRPYLRPDGYAVLFIAHVVRESTTMAPVIASQTNPCPLDVLHDEDEFLAFVRRCVHARMAHEADEMLRVDDKVRWHPHGPKQREEVRPPYACPAPHGLRQLCDDPSCPEHGLLRPRRAAPSAVQAGTKENT